MTDQKLCICADPENCTEELEGCRKLAGLPGKGRVTDQQPEKQERWKLIETNGFESAYIRFELHDERTGNVYKISAEIEVEHLLAALNHYEATKGMVRISRERLECLLEAAESTHLEFAGVEYEDRFIASSVAQLSECIDWTKQALENHD